MSALSAIETEQLRDIRARLNRVPKGPAGDKSVGPMSKGFFDVCARVGLAAAAPVRARGTPDRADYPTAPGRSRSSFRAASKRFATSAQFATDQIALQ